MIHILNITVVRFSVTFYAFKDAFHFYYFLFLLIPPSVNSTKHGAVFIVCNVC